MVNKLLQIQIPQYWELIKFALKQVLRIKDEYATEVYNKVLAALLNDKAQCFVKRDGSNVQAIAITEIREEPFTKRKTLWIRCLYGFSSATPINWDVDIKLIKECAKEWGCYKIMLDTPFDKVAEKISKIGFIKVISTYELEV